MVSTTLICVSHPCRLILSSWHILSCLMEDKPYLVDTCLVVASSWCWLLDLLEVSQRPLYTGTPSVLYIMLDHAGSWHIEYIVILIIFGLLCLCWAFWSWENIALKKILTWYQRWGGFSSHSHWRPCCFIPRRDPIQIRSISSNWEHLEPKRTFPLRLESWFGEDRL